MDTSKWAGLLRLMTYGLTMPGDPMSDIDGAFKSAIDEATHSDAVTYLEAIRTALASDLDLSDAIGLDLHTDAVIRKYLQAVEQRLARELQAGR